jgi:hypothetical protein
VKVFPKEVEHVLYEHPAVAECAVVGIPDERKGETVKAYIVLRAGYEPSEALAEEIRQHCLRELAAYKHPREIEFCEGAPQDSLREDPKVRAPRALRAQLLRSPGLLGLWARLSARTRCTAYPKNPIIPKIPAIRKTFGAVGGEKTIYPKPMKPTTPLSKITTAKISSPMMRSLLR